MGITRLWIVRSQGAGCIMMIRNIKGRFVPGHEPLPGRDPVTGRFQVVDIHEKVDSILKDHGVD